jgi:hypothetical protein
VISAVIMNAAVMQSIGLGRAAGKRAELTADSLDQAEVRNGGRLSGPNRHDVDGRIEQ